MVKHFLTLEWKQFFRAATMGKSLALKILMGFFALYFMASFLIMGVALYPLLKDMFPDQDPFNIVNGFIFYWILADLMIRFFLQKLPVMTVKPLLVIPIKRSSVVHYVLGKSVLSFFNFLPLFAIIPFGMTLLLKDYDATSVITWMFLMVVLVQINNFLNLIIESISAATELSFLPILVVVSGLYALNHFGIIDLSGMVSTAVTAILGHPWLILVPLAILAALYSFNFKILRKKLYLDSSLQTKVDEVKTTHMAWTNKFGDMAPFMQLDLKLLWRNKRSRSSVWMLGLGLLYGLFFYPQPMYQEMVWLYAFIGIFVTGIFLINFGQFIPAWDSGYYKLLMSQNIKYEQYLKSKYTLMTLSVIILFVLSIPYVYFGWKILLAHFATAVYNVGVNTHVILLGGSYNRKKIDLNQRAAFNFQGTGAVQWLIGLPLMILPMLIFAGFYYAVNFEAGIAALIVLGLLGIVFHQKIMAFIIQKYMDSKYKMIDAFSQDN